MGKELYIPTQIEHRCYSNIIKTSLSACFMTLSLISSLLIKYQMMMSYDILPYDFITILLSEYGILRL